MRKKARAIVREIYEIIDGCPVLHGERDERKCVCLETAEELILDLVKQAKERRS